MTEVEQEPTGGAPAPGTEGPPAYETGGLRLAVLVAVVAYVGIAHGWSWVIVIFGIVLMIFLHELGHYLTARWTGMKATEFFIGFGPKIWSFTRGETEYGLKVIPAGAYVRIIGMNNLEEVPPEDEARTYRHQSFPRRLLVVSAGSLMHLLQAFIVAIILLVFVGTPGGTLVSQDKMERSWIVAEVTPDSAAEQAGLRNGDRIAAWNGQTVSTWDDVTAAVRRAGPGGDARLTIERDGETFETDVELGGRWEVGAVVPDSAAADAGLQPDDRILAWDGEPVGSFEDISDAVESAAIGDEVTLTVDRNGETIETAAELDGGRWVVEDVQEDTPAYQAGLRADDHVIEWDGEPVGDIDDLAALIEGTEPGDEVALTVERDGESQEITGPVTGADIAEVPFLGVDAASAAFLGVGAGSDEMTLGLFEGIGRATQETGETLWMTTKAVGQFFSPSSLGDFFSSAFNGGDEPDGEATTTSGDEAGSSGNDDRMISIFGAVRIGNDLAGENMGRLLFLFFAINITIGLINMAPLLPLDGGHAAVAIYERLRSRNGQRYYVDVAKLMPMVYAVVMVLLFIGVAALWLDIVDPIQV